MSALFPTHQVSLEEVEFESTPELEPIFSYLSTQANKLYYEGYLLRLNDLDISECAVGSMAYCIYLTDILVDGQKCRDRQWVECFAQLIGSVIWMWDAAALDEAGEYGDVHPSHINVADAIVSIVSSKYSLHIVAVHVFSTFFSTAPTHTHTIYIYGLNTSTNNHTG